MTALGSGIYSPDGPLNFTYNATGGSELVIAEVPILSPSTRSSMRAGGGQSVEDTSYDVDRSTVDVGYSFENISGYSRAPLVRGQHEMVRLCHGETFCCEASHLLLGDSQVRIRS